MSDITLGELITGTGERDAIHVALAPVKANERLKPGQHVGFVRRPAERLNLQHPPNRERDFILLRPLGHHWPPFGLMLRIVTPPLGLGVGLTSPGIRGT